MAESSFTYDLTAAQGQALKTALEENGFEFKPLAYGHFQAKRGKCNLAYYESGRLVIQGKESPEVIEFIVEPFVLGAALLGYEEVHDPQAYEPHFGIDESGKGDFFGPLVIAGVYVDGDIVRALKTVGAKDSKKIGSDALARRLAGEIKRVPGLKHTVIVIGPKRYNELYLQFRNLNRLLAWGHAKVIETLHQQVPACPRALSDQFANPALIQRELKAKKLTIELDSRTKAESDMAVAAASILARAAFLEKLEDLGKPLEVKLLKGASAQVKAQGRLIYEKVGVEGLADVAKAHFKTFREVTGELSLGGD
jgi:ribonuclease HIII